MLDQQDVGVNFRWRLFIAYSEDAEQLEVISYNEDAGRFEFEIVDDFASKDKTKKPSIRFANRAFCAGCHQKLTHIFPISPWNKTFENPEMVTLFKEKKPGKTHYHDIGLGPKFSDYDKFPFITADSAQVDNDTNLSGTILDLPLYWSILCGPESVKGAICRSKQLLLMLISPQDSPIGGLEIQGPLKDIRDSLLLTYMTNITPELQKQEFESFKAERLPDLNPLAVYGKEAAEVVAQANNLNDSFRIMKTLLAELGVKSPRGCCDPQDFKHIDMPHYTKPKKEASHLKLLKPFFFHCNECHNKTSERPIFIGDTDAKLCASIRPKLGVIKEKVTSGAMPPNALEAVQRDEILLIITLLESRSCESLDNDTTSPN